MKTWLKSLSLVFGIWSCLLTGVWAQPSRPSGDDAAAIQAIQQAPDPSAVVAAYGNGLALNHNDPKLHAAYVSRMVDLGLPELAYHQAEMLTTIDSSNGLAYGVVAYVNARRGQMTDAISAINVAAPLAPDNPFVQRTAGEILAWYDLKSDKTSIPDNIKEGLAKVRDSVGRSIAFTQAYDTAKKAYESQASAGTTTQPSSDNSVTVPSLLQPESSTVASSSGTYATGTPAASATAPLTPPSDYPDYSPGYNSGYYPSAYYPN